MPEVQIKHAFVSTKPDSPDTSIVSSSEWNAPEIASGGAHGQLLVRDATVASGISSVHAASITGSTGTYSGASPSPALANSVATFTSSATIILFATVIAVVSDGSTVSCDLRRDGVSIGIFPMGGTGLTSTTVSVRAEAVGAHTYSIVCTLASGTFTSLIVYLQTISIGYV